MLQLEVNLLGQVLIAGLIDVLVKEIEIAMYIGEFMVGIEAHCEEENELQLFSVERESTSKW
jgi:hypothetical protein